MAMTLAALTAETQRSIQAHFITGHFTLDEALTRIQHGGMTTLTREQAVEVLRSRIMEETVKAYTGRDVTAEEITARLAEVTA